MRPAPEWALAATLIAGLAAVGCGESGDQSGESEPSAVSEERLYNPYTQTGDPNPDLELTSESGSCGGGSAIVPRPDAWRCFAERTNTILDPCFSATGERGVICPEAPWQEEAIQLELAERLPSGAAGGATGASVDPARAWGIELVDGRRCLFGGGATRSVAGERINYFCDDESYLAGEVDRSSEPWTILSGGSESTSLEDAEVRIVWR